LEQRTQIENFQWNFYLLLRPEHSFKLCHLKALGKTRYLQKGALGMAAGSVVPFGVVCQKGPETSARGAVCLVVDK